MNILNMEIRIRNSAIKDLKRISPDLRKKIHTKIISLKDFPDVTNVKKLTNFEPAYRLRIGDYRILFDVLDDCIEIGRILHRKESYK
ncbi:mRNA interferase RelE/StbE [Draconibacterium orientale]|uniref:mRNA interferase RelE/StbE n=2 Tax=Draconibacterium orientale TaxID=1168034 RepID=A0A1I0GVY1_9BACT|nr:mRNA interferase RelE/StbE [Draconibacterium orientale]